MIAAAAVVPGALLLLPEYASLVDPGAPVREAAAAAVADVLAADPDELVVLAPGAAPRPGDTRPPAGLRVARALLDRLDVPEGLDVHEVVVGDDASAPECEALGAMLGDDPPGRAGPVRTGLVVVADGAGRACVDAPGAANEEVGAYDTVWREAVRAGEPAALTALDADRAARLLAPGRAPLQVLAAATAGARPRVRVHYDAAPFEVAYVAASWRV